MQPHLMISVAELKIHSRFSNVSTSTLEWLAPRFSRETFEKGRIVLRQGEPSLKLRVVESGLVKVYRTLESGRELILHLWGAGGVLAEAPLIDAGPTPFTIVAQEDTTMLTLPRADFLSALEKDHVFSFAAIQSLAERSVVLIQRVHELGEGGVEARLAQVLRGFAEKGEATEEGSLIPFRLTRQELANLVGARTETVIRLIKKWEKQAIIESRPDSILILDSPAMTRITEKMGE